MTTEFNNFYFETLKKVLNRAFTDYQDPEGRAPSLVDAEIVRHMYDTTKQHYQPAPDTNYADPLCRLGYLYTHAGANATLFERAITNSNILKKMLKDKNAGRLAICALGGGPGTELLGLTKYLLINAEGIAPTEIRFRVLDRVDQWSETWEHIADACTDALAQNGIFVTVQPFSNKIDVMDPASYTKFAWAFRNVDLFVFNYLLSENQVQLSNFACTLTEMVSKASPNSTFVFIDRIEYDYNSTFKMETVKDIIKSAQLIVQEDFQIGHVMTDDKNVWGEYLQRFYPRKPRYSFMTDGDRKPTAQVLVATGFAK